MRHTTHILFSIFIIVVIYELIPPLKSIVPFTYAIAIAPIRALFPDLDHPKSYISQGYWGILSIAICKTTPHRGWTHSLVGAALFTAILTVLLWYFKASISYALIFFIGYVTHLLSDSLNPTGVNWLWPKPKKYSFYSIRTGSKEEETLQTLLIFAITGILVYDVLYNASSLLK
ncbi:MAG: metal-dependent hydrolase [Archaeoglobales archaeon]|nr:MAG: metal-dependent hydrolase [Archaeoglobales archaeon]